MLIGWISVVVAVVGLVMWALAQAPIPKEAGKILFTCGVLVSLFATMRSTVELLR